MFKFFKQIAGPTIFTKGILQFKQRQYGIAKQLFVKAVQWMPSLQSDPLYTALVRLCDHHLGTISDGSTDQFQHLIDALEASPHKDTSDYTFAVSEIRYIMGSMR